MNDNTSKATYLLLKHLKVKLTSSYLSKQLLMHPNYPSLLSISDILKDYSIENDALKISTYDQLQTFKPPFITHLILNSGTFAVVKKVNKEFITLAFEENLLETVSKERFIKIWDNIILVAQPTQNSIEPNYRKHKNIELISKFKIVFLIILGIFTLTSQIYYNSFLYQLLFLYFSKFIGSFFIFLLIKKELGHSSNLADKICNFAKSAGCNEVIKSKASKIYGNIFLADLGLIWFVTSTLYLFLTFMYTSDFSKLWLLGWLSLFSLPMIFFSISYQIFSVKKFCPLCIGVMLTLLLDILLFLHCTTFDLNFLHMPI